MAQQELGRSGLKMDVKTVRRIAQQCGEGLLVLRREELLRWREGKLPSGTELKGQRVTVQIDGGRTKIRGNLRAASPAAEATDSDGLPSCPPRHSALLCASSRHFTRAAKGHLRHVARTAKRQAGKLAENKISITP